MFQRLTDEEAAYIDKIKKRKHHVGNFGAMEIQYFTQGNFTVVLIREGRNVHVGVAKRNCETDQFSTEIGNNVAISRAIANKPITI